MQYHLVPHYLVDKEKVGTSQINYVNFVPEKIFEVVGNLQLNLEASVRVEPLLEQDSEVKVTCWAGCALGV